MRKEKRAFPYHLHVSRAVLASLCFLAVGILHAPASLLPVQKVASSAPQVLAYATNINRADLVAQTNAARAANGLAGYSENAQLNVAAQLKANDMIANNYWAHTSPSGVQPWYWFTAAGYDYASAGENLAYGFATSDGVVNGWMNSPGHRANILGAFQDVGHGIANGENYQGNQNTVVVAHYGKPRATPPPAPVAPVTPAAPSQSAPKQSQPVTSAPAASEPTPQAPVADTPSNSTPVASEEKPKEEKLDTASAAPSANTSSIPVAAPTQASTPVWQQLLSGQAPLLVLVSLSIIVVVGIGYTATHVRLVRRAVVMGEQYALHHPVFDASFVIAATAVILLTTIGRVG